MTPHGVDLAPQTVVGLPRSNLVKAKAAPSAVAAVVPPPLEVPVALSPVSPVSEEPVALVREALDTKADEIEVEIGEATAREPNLELPAARGPYASAPSTGELLERAAALGAMRTNWESIVLPDDPILDEKRTPHVTERRARLTRVVKITLGACLGLCVLAVGVSAISGDSSPRAAAPADSSAVGKTVASTGIVPVESLDGTKHAKAVRRVAPAATTAAIVRPKRR